MNMLNKAKTLEGYKLDSIDGDIGKVKDIYFDDKFWTVRYLVVEAGNWITPNMVLISPYSLIDVDQEDRDIQVDLTKKKIKESPSYNSDKPVSRQFEDAYYGYYGWPSYWDGDEMWGRYPSIMRDPKKWGIANQGGKTWNSHLRSTHKVAGYHIQATNGEIGHIEDFIIDHDRWTIRYLIIDTKNWLQGKRILISPQWIKNIDWRNSKIFVNLSCEEIKQAPEYTESSLLTREYESKLYGHYSRQGYWDDELVPMKGSS